MNNDFKLRSVNKGLLIFIYVMLFFNYNLSSEIGGFLSLFLLVFWIATDIKMNNSFKKQVKSLGISSLTSGVLMLIFSATGAMDTISINPIWGGVVVAFCTFIYGLFFSLFSFIFKCIGMVFKGGNKK